MLIMGATPRGLCIIVTIHLHLLYEDFSKNRPWILMFSGNEMLPSLDPWIHYLSFPTPADDLQYRRQDIGSVCGG